MYLVLLETSVPTLRIYRYPQTAPMQLMASTSRNSEKSFQSWLYSRAMLLSLAQHFHGDDLRRSLSRRKVEDSTRLLSNHRHMPTSRRISCQPDRRLDDNRQATRINEQENVSSRIIYTTSSRIPMIRSDIKRELLIDKKEQRVPDITISIISQSYSQ